MPRIARPAQTQIKPPYTKPANGVVRDEALAALASLTEQTAMTPDELFPQVPSCASVHALRATLRTLAKQGLIHVRGGLARGKQRAFYWPITAPDSSPDTSPLNPRDKGRMEMAHRASADAPAPDLALPTVEEIIVRGVTEHDPASHAAADLGLDTDTPGTLRFALWDNGELLLAKGDEMMVLQATETKRLWGFLDGAADVVDQPWRKERA